MHAFARAVWPCRKWRRAVSFAAIRRKEVREASIEEGEATPCFSRSRNRFRQRACLEDRAAFGIKESSLEETEHDTKENITTEVAGRCRQFGFAVRGNECESGR